MLNLILFGAPGSGKGTQSPMLVERYGIVHISTGDLFRYEMGNNTPLGLKAKEYSSKGELVPDEITIGMLRNKVESLPDAKGFIFDGFPRTVPQAIALDAFLAEKGTSVSLLVALDVDNEELVSRLLGRGATSGRADDLDENIIRNRLNVYQNETAIVAEHYGKSNKSVFLNGVGTVEEVFGRLTNAIDALK